MVVNLWRKIQISCISYERIGNQSWGESNSQMKREKFDCKQNASFWLVFVHFVRHSVKNISYHLVLLFGFVVVDLSEGFSIN